MDELVNCIIERMEFVKETNAKLKELLTGLLKATEELIIDEASYENSCNAIEIVRSRKRRGWKR